MHQTLSAVVHKSLRSRVLPVLALGVMLAAFLLVQVSGFRAVRAGNHTLAAVVALPCSSAEVTGAPASPQTVGASVTFTGSSTGCTTPEYKFYTLAPGETAWIAKTNFSATTTFVWNTVGAASGIWQVAVWARNVGSTANYQAYAIRSYELASNACTSASINAAPAQPQAPGASITFTATAAGCPSATFEFWYLPVGSSTWSVVRPYSATATFVWATVAGTAKGPYRFGVRARQAGSTASYDTYALMTYWINS